MSKNAEASTRAGAQSLKAAPRLLRLSEVCQRTGLSKSTIHAKWRDGSMPSPLRLSERALAFREDDIERWIAELPLATASLGSEDVRVEGLDKR